MRRLGSLNSIIPLQTLSPAYPPAHSSSAFLFSSKSIDVAPKNGESRLRVMPKLKSSHEFDGVRFPPAPRDLVLHLVFGQNAFYKHDKEHSFFLKTKT